MKKLFTLIALSSTAFVSAQSYQQAQSYDQQRNYNSNYGSQKTDRQGPVSDVEIEKKIKDKLSSGLFTKGFENVSYEVNNGNVNLSGTVDTLENKTKVEDAVKKIAGVRQVNDQITVAKGMDANTYSDSQLRDSEKKYPNDQASTPQDRQINAKIRHKISDRWFSKGNETLVIKTANGVVIISGTVDKPEDVQKISEKIKEIAGVRSINNQLTTKNK